MSANYGCSRCLKTERHAVHPSNLHGHIYEANEDTDMVVTRVLEVAKT